MIIRDGFISTGFIMDKKGVARHLLIQWHRSWRWAYRKPSGKPGYRRLYIGPIEIEWSKFQLRP